MALWRTAFLGKYPDKTFCEARVLILLCLAILPSAMMNEEMYENKDFGVESEPEPEPEFDITNVSMEVMTSVNVEMVLDEAEEMAETMSEMDMEEVAEFEGEEDTVFTYMGDPGSGLGMEEGIEKIHIALTGEEESVSTEAVYRADYNLTFPGNMEVEVFRSG